MNRRKIPVANGVRPPRKAPRTADQIRRERAAETNERIARNWFRDPLCYERPNGLD